DAANAAAIPASESAGRRSMNASQFGMRIMSSASPSSARAALAPARIDRSRTFLHLVLNLGRIFRALERGMFDVRHIALRPNALAIERQPHRDAGALTEPAPGTQGAARAPH